MLCNAYILWVVYFAGAEQAFVLDMYVDGMGRKAYNVYFPLSQIAFGCLSAEVFFKSACCAYMDSKVFLLFIYDFWLDDD